MGYRPNLLGRALAAGSASLVLLISPMPFAPYYVEISRHLSAQAAKHGYTFLSGGTVSEHGANGIPADDWLYGVDGIVVCDFLPHQEAYVVEALRLKIPIVGLGVRHPFPSDFVKIDLRTATLALMDHFVAQGCRNVAMMGAPGTSREDPRVKAYLEVSEAWGKPPVVLAAQNQSRASGRQAIHDHFREGAPIDGLFCENDVLALGAYRGLVDLGVRVPQDVLLAGCDGLEEMAYQYTPLTTLVQPYERMCEMAWSMLQQRMNGSTEPARTVELAATLQPRMSTSREA
jgi:LacI family transcriptional regulator